MTHRRLNPEESEVLAAARLVAARHLPYLSSAVFAMVPCIADVGSAAVDRRWRLYLDPKALARWTVVELAGVLLHESLHLLRHHFDRGQRNGVGPSTRLRWNLASDCAINDDLDVAGITLPQGSVTPKRLGLPESLTEEDYYGLLATSAASSDEEWDVDHGSGADGMPRPWDLPDSGLDGANDGTPKGRSRAEIVGIVKKTRAAIDRHVEAHGIGSAPAGIVRWSAGSTRSVVPWRATLRHSLLNALRVRPGIEHPTWARPSRRHDPSSPFLMPGRHETDPLIAVVVDTSASMRQRLLDQAVSEIQNIQRRRLATIRVVSCDTNPHDHGLVRTTRGVGLVGGGGTSLASGMALAAERPVPDAIVVITDGHTPWPSRRPGGVSAIAVLLDSRAPDPATPGIRTIRVNDFC